MSQAKPVSEPPAAPPPRFVVTVTSTGHRDSLMAFAVHGEDVTAFEVASVLLHAADALLNDPSHKLPSDRERSEIAKAEQLLKKNPAVRLFVNGQAQLYLGTAALEAVGSQLIVRGWLDAGPLPEGLTKACMRAADSAGFDAHHLAPPAPIN